MNVINQFLVTHLNVKPVGFPQEKKLAPGLLCQLAATAGLIEFLGVSAENHRVTGIPDRIVELRHRKILPEDPSVITAHVGPSLAGQEISRIPVKEKSEAHDAKKDDQDRLRLAAKELHHNVHTLRLGTGKENMIVA